MGIIKDTAKKAVNTVKTVVQATQNVASNGLSKAIIDYIEMFVNKCIDERLKKDGVFTSLPANVISVNSGTTSATQRCGLDLGFTTLESVANKTNEMLRVGDAVTMMQRFGTNYTDCYIAYKTNTFIEDTTTEEQSDSETDPETWEMYEDIDHYWVAPNWEAGTNSYIMTNWFDVPLNSTPQSGVGGAAGDETWRSVITPRIDYLMLSGAPSDGFPTAPGAAADYMILRQDILTAQDNVLTPNPAGHQGFENIVVHVNWTPFNSNTSNGIITDKSLTPFQYTVTPNINMTGQSPTITSADGIVYSRRSIFQVVLRYRRIITQEQTGSVFKLRQIVNANTQNADAFLLYPVENPLFP